MARKVVKASNNDDQYPELPVDEVLPVANTDLRLDYAFHKLGKMVETWMVDHKLGCPDTRDREEGM